jgi:hypothetical protein
MTIFEAINEVLEKSSHPRDLPAGARSFAGEELLELVEKKVVRFGKERPEKLTEAQEQVARLVWRLCANVLVTRFASEFDFVDGFRAERNRDHEIALWLDFTLLFNKFIRKYPSENRENVLKSLIRLSIGLPPEGIPGKRARELAKLWGRFKRDGVDRADLEWLFSQAENQ